VKASWLEGWRLPVAPAGSVSTVVGVDPADSGQGDSCGIVAASLTSEGVTAVIADVSAPMTSDAWARAAVRLAVDVGASEISVESFAAGETYRRVVREALASEGVRRPIKVSSWPPKRSGRGRGGAGDGVGRLDGSPGGVGVGWRSYRARVESQSYRYPEPSPIESSVGATNELAEVLSSPPTVCEHVAHEGRCDGDVDDERRCPCVGGGDHPAGPPTFTVSAPPGWFEPGVPVTFTRTRVPGPKSAEEVQADLAASDGAVASVHQPLLDRAGALIQLVAHGHPRALEQLAVLLRDVARALVER